MRGGEDARPGALGAGGVWLHGSELRDRQACSEEIFRQLLLAGDVEGLLKTFLNRITARTLENARQHGDDEDFVQEISLIMIRVFRRLSKRHRRGAEIPSAEAVRRRLLDEATNLIHRWYRTAAERERLQREHRGKIEIGLTARGEACNGTCSADPVLAEVCKREREDRVHEAVRELPEELAELFEVHYVEQLSNAKVAERFGCTEEHVHYMVGLLHERLRSSPELRPLAPAAETAASGAPGLPTGSEPGPARRAGQAGKGLRAAPLR